jgi:alpha-glucuronidase
VNRREETRGEAWLRCALIEDGKRRGGWAARCNEIVSAGDSPVLRTARDELSKALHAMVGTVPFIVNRPSGDRFVALGTFGCGLAQIDALADAGTSGALGEEGYVIRGATGDDGALSCIAIAGNTDRAVLYGTFHFIRLLRQQTAPEPFHIAEAPANKIRMINQWDNMDGTIERGYAGQSIFYRNNGIVSDLTRVREYARLLASVGINAVAINNVNVHRYETKLITEEYLPSVERVAGVFRAYGIRTYLSINFASPIEIGGMATADPLEQEVRRWWREKAADIYRHIPDFGGFLVKADSEFRPGPFTYGRNHADGANMLAEALEPYGGLVLWRCFVYNCLQDWRDRKTDRARAAYDHFKPLDGRFRDNVVLQIKNGPIDFQVREPVSPLFGGMQETNQVLELQITQEYTGQQVHLCYLVPQWKEALGFDTYAEGPGSTLAEIASGRVYGRPCGGFTAVSNIGDDPDWTGHPLAQANLYGYGRLAWNPALSSEQIAREWIRLALDADRETENVIADMMLRSWSIYESYTAPLGVGFMVNPGHHYGPNVDGYEYSKWGTYHFADCRGIGVDRTVRSGTAYTAQYHPPQSDLYESPEQCPDELLLFFHHVPYTHVLKSGITVIQHIYDSHFEGAEQAAELLGTWDSLQGKVEEGIHSRVRKRLAEQAEHAKEWRDVLNTYFLRKSGIPDERGRRIY